MGDACFFGFFMYVWHRMVSSQFGISFAPFTYIKMDIEGVEFVVLYGGYEYLRSNKPKLNVACYHRCCDIYRLPNMLKRVNPDYKIYMRHHPCIPSWETNLYCI